VQPRNELEALPCTDSPRSIRRALPRAIAVCSWLSLLALLASLPLLYASDLWWPATLLLFSPRWLPIVPLTILILAATRWRRRSLGLLLLSLLLLLVPVMGFTWHLASPTSPQGRRLRVLTCNMHRHDPENEVWLRLLAELHPDIVAVQELPSEEHTPPFPDTGWHQHQKPGLFVASRFPIEQTVWLGSDSMSLTGSVMRYRLQTPAGNVTLFNLHFATPRDGLYEILHHPRTGIALIEDNSAVRWQQFEHLRGRAREAAGPVLLMGDFNTPPESAIFRRLWSGYTDAFSAAGWGWGYTFLGARTTVRIDHILAGPGWHCERCWVGPNLGSPHRPVVADLIWTAESNTEPRP
jgi:endonuclease/exonuclease/phosphatase (EEP) superfamily protein YafD